MTMLSFRVADSEALEAQRWAEALGVERSVLLRDALHRHLVRLRSEGEPDVLASTPLSDAELAVVRSRTGDRQRTGRTGLI